jgi:hypothetical protein
MSFRFSTRIFGLIGGYMLVLVSRAPVLVAFQGRIRSVDEIEMALSSVDRFLGLPSTALAWPGSILQLLFLPIWVVSWLASEGVPFGAHQTMERFGQYIARAYAEPLVPIFMLRCVAVVLSSLAPIAMYLIARRLFGRLAGLMGAMLVALSQPFLEYSTIASGDGASISFALLSFGLILAGNPEPPIVMLAGMVFGAALAAKVTVLSLGFLSLGAALGSAPKFIEALRRAGLWCAGAACGVLVFCPYVWVDPLRLAKSVIGNATRTGQPLGVAGLLRAMGDWFGLPFMMLLGIGLAAATILCLRRGGEQTLSKCSP